MKDPQQHSLGFLNRSIDKGTAVGRTTEWRGLYKDTMKCKDPEVLRGYFIPIEPCRFQRRKRLESPLFSVTLMRGKYLLYIIN